MAEKKVINSLIECMKMSKMLVMASVSDGTTEEQSMFHLEPGKSNIVWLVGHMAWTYDSFVGTAAGRESQLPKDFAQKFGTGTQPSENPADYPSIEEMQKLLSDTFDSVIEVLESKDDDLLAQPLPDGSPLKLMFKTMGDILWLSVFHSGYHSGQIALLRRAQGLPSGIGM